MRKATYTFIAFLALIVSLAALAGVFAGAPDRPIKLDELNGPAIAVSAVKLEYAAGVPALFALAPNPLDKIAAANGRVVTLSYTTPEYLDTLPVAQRNYLKTTNAYAIEIGPESINIVGADANGLIYGVDDLAILLAEGDGKLRQGRLINWPDHKMRVLHVVIRDVSPEKIRELFDRARGNRFNAVILQLGDNVAFQSRAVSPRPNALSKQEFVQLVAYARASGLDVIPQIQLLTHQHKFFKNKFPELMYNQMTYDPRIPKVYELVFEYIDEVIDTVNPIAIDIGHDEVAGSTPSSKKKTLKKGETVLPPALFLQDVVTLNDYITGRGLRTWMWGDMLISHDEFATMQPADFNGINGYSSIRKDIPKDVVIMDWHYYQGKGDFTSTQTFAKEGHEVMGATWKNKKNIQHFSEYVANMKPPGKGMVATMWFHVPRGEWELVNEIIDTSGRYFWSAED